MTVLIPAYKPDECLISVLRELKSADEDLRLLVVDDGGGDTYAYIFREAESIGAIVLHHDVNRGKGAALKTGFAWLTENGETEGCVTADADGQHLTEDILKVAAALRENPEKLVIGGRAFNKKGVPLRSKLGNYASRFTFNLLYNQCIGDTQTGLRGIPAPRLSDMLEIPGERYEFEMNMLMRARALDLDLYETRIQTVYLDEDNSASHFNPVKDAMRVYLPLLRGGLGLIIAAAVYTALYFLLPSFGVQLIAAIELAPLFAAMLVRGLDLMIRRKFRLLRFVGVLSFIEKAAYMVLVSNAALLIPFAFMRIGGEAVTFVQMVAQRSDLFLTWYFLGNILFVIILCAIRGIKIRRVK